MKPRIVQFRHASEGEGKMDRLHGVCAALAAISATAPVSHVWELPNKFQIADGQFWLAVQKALYVGWGPVIGAIWVATFLALLALTMIRRSQGKPYAAALFATLCYVAMFGVFLIYNSPVNKLVLQWTAETLPANWGAYRVSWETGHALSALLSVCALIVILPFGHANRESES